MTTTLIAIAVAVGACRAEPTPEAQSRACLDEAMRALATPPSTADHATLTCADPFGDHRCRAAWRTVAEVPSESAVVVAIDACHATMCARVGDATLQLCADRSSATGFVGQLAWVELFRAALEPELGHTRTMALLGFWQALMQPSTPRPSSTARPGPPP
ncbi:MAG: hypothetical protein ACKV2T_21515 [Kofleriaceae bacterium]